MKRKASRVRAAAWAKVSHGDRISIFNLYERRPLPEWGYTIFRVLITPINPKRKRKVARD